MDGLRHVTPSIERSHIMPPPTPYPTLLLTPLARRVQHTCRTGRRKNAIASNSMQYSYVRMVVECDGPTSSPQHTPHCCGPVPRARRQRLRYHTCQYGGPIRAKRLKKS